MQAKQNLFRDSIARHKKSSGVTAALLSVGNVNIDEMIAKLVAKMDNCRDKIDTCDLSADAEQLKGKLEVSSIVFYYYIDSELILLFTTICFQRACILTSL